MFEGKPCQMKAGLFFEFDLFDTAQLKLSYLILLLWEARPRGEL